MIVPSVIRCICGGTRPALSCCLRKGGVWFKAPAIVGSIDSRTGFTHPGCYASATRDCSQHLSREHLIPESILRKQSSSGMNEVSGFRANGGQRGDIPAKRLVSRVLCTRHNEALSPLDAESDRLFATLRDFNRQTREAITESRLFSGDDIERFMLKCLCAMIASGNAWKVNWDGNLAIDPQLIEILFENKPIDYFCGLRLLAPVGGQFAYSEHIGVAPTRMRPPYDGVTGIMLIIGGFQFVLSPTRPVGPSRRNYLRPGRITFTVGNAVKSIILSWSDTRPHDTVNIWRNPSTHC